MDHRCLYGHRVLASFTFAIQNRSCPTCGAATVSIHGYAAARKLSLEGGMDALAAFNAMRLLESDWKLVPVEAAVEAAATPARPAALAAAEEDGGTTPAAVPMQEEVEIVEESDSAAAPPPRPAAAAAAAVKPVVRSRPARAERDAATNFDASEAEFFKS